MAAKLEDAVQKQFDQGVAWLRDHLLNHAEVMLRRALAAAPGHPAIQRHLGIALVKLGRNEDGIAMLRSATGRLSYRTWVRSRSKHARR
jgi:predicted Zn-dependent protease